MKRKTIIFCFVITAFFLMIIMPVKVYASDYTISFTGTGASTTVDSVIVQNLTKGTSVIVPANYSLQLLDVTAVEQVAADYEVIRIIPNPISDKSVVSFYANQSGNTHILVTEIDGRTVTELNTNLPKGKNSFQLSLSIGAYILKVIGNGYSYSSIIISQCALVSKPLLTFIGNEITTSSKAQKSKNTSAVTMTYSAGDQLLYKGFSGKMCTKLTDQPTSSKTANLEFKETVFTEILANTNYSMLNNAFNTYFKSTLKEELLTYDMNGDNKQNYTVLLLSDSLLTADGFSWTWTSYSNSYSFANSNSGSLSGYFDASARMQRLVKSHIFRRIKTADLNCAITNFTTDPAFATAYGGYSYAVNDYGDMIRYKDSKVQMMGNYDEADWVTATPYKTFSNGQAFKTNKMLQYSRRTTYPSAPEGYKPQDLVTYIINMVGGTQNTNVATFKNYLVACLKGDGSNELAGLSADMVLTIFMPTNAAMTKAVTDGYLPDYTTLMSGDIAARLKATKFVLHHIVKGKVFVDDGLPYIMPNNEVVTEEVHQSILKSDVFDNTHLDTTYLSVRKDENGRLLVSTQVYNTGKKLSNITKTATVTRGANRSNYFGTNAVFHEIDDYMVYEYPQGNTPLDNSKAEAVYWELTDQPEVKALATYRTPGSSVIFKPGELSELSFGGKNNPTIIYSTTPAWATNAQYVHGDFFEIPLRPNVLQWMEIKTPILKEGVYKVWFCWRRGGNNNLFKTTFKQDGKKDQVMPFTFDLGEYFNTTATSEVNLQNGAKQYNAKARYSVVCSRTVGAIRVETAGRHTLRIDALSGSAQAWWDMIQFIPIDQNQLWPRFDAAGYAIAPGTPCEQIYPYDQPCVGDLSN